MDGAVDETSTIDITTIDGAGGESSTIDIATLRIKSRAGARFGGSGSPHRPLHQGVELPPGPGTDWRRANCSRRS